MQVRYQAALHAEAHDYMAILGQYWAWIEKFCEFMGIDG